MAILSLPAALVLAGCESVTREPPPPPPAPAKTAKPAFKPVKAERVLLEKGKRTLTVFHKGKPYMTYRVALGRNPVGAKTCSGDYRTPEGQYTITGQNDNSRFYRSLRLSYPNPRDVARAKQQKCNPGGNVAIHGLENGYGWVGRTHRDADWTNGCVAVTNEEMNQLWQMMPIGTRVEILP